MGTYITFYSIAQLFLQINTSILADDLLLVWQEFNIKDS